MRICIIGYGLCGKALYHFCKIKGYDVCVFDDVKKDSFILNSLESVDSFDYVIISPGIRPCHKIYQMAVKAGNIISEMQFSLMHVGGKKVAITGTNGKTSATTLLFKALKKSNDHVFLAGNIGTPLIELYNCASQKSLIILEISSYQLELLEGKPFEYGLILNIQEDHLDSYKDFEEYKNVKLSLFERVKSKCYFNKNESIDQQLIKIALSLGASKDDFLTAKKEFRGLEHRLEKILVYNNVLCINDSKSTNPASTLYAIDQFHEKLYLIVGGYDKGLSFLSWQKKFYERVERVFVMGQSAKKIENVLSNYCRVEYIKGFNEAFDIVFNEAKHQSVLLFSPGCSSFDQYRDYKERGALFVRSLDNYVKKRNNCRMFFDECSAYGDSICRSD